MIMTQVSSPATYVKKRNIQKNTKSQSEISVEKHSMLKRLLVILTFFVVIVQQTQSSLSWGNNRIIVFFILTKNVRVKSTTHVFECTFPTGGLNIVLNTMPV